ncbi:histidine phosphatase family protein [Nocardioides guangzhouensis]|uniref:Histidine phosphatase family protein n=1 Tax=Nocardioides guangzhouensis TaxID=2497878 RepID=A0A4Q4ZEJ4_9ACTN|nr:histidine phosphatase family protein [Nocardioides guangzhouensis]RYP85811.1 histidine phosphatase family protein [Nocardioides guangzhouensis]
MTRIHADAAGHEDADPGISDLGRRQVGALAQRLAGRPVTEVWHGPRRRAAETAALIADLLDAALVPSALLDDRTAVPSEGWRDDYPRHGWPWLDAVPPAERDEDGRAMTEAWHELLDATAGREVVLVTHAFVLSWFVTRVLDAGPASWLRMPVANAALTTIGLDLHGDLTLEAFNLA